jgi:hypothetical protein
MGALPTPLTLLNLNLSTYSVTADGIRLTPQLQLSLSLMQLSVLVTPCLRGFIAVSSLHRPSSSPSPIRPLLAGPMTTASYSGALEDVPDQPRGRLGERLGDVGTRRNHDHGGSGQGFRESGPLLVSHNAEGSKVVCSLSGRAHTLQHPIGDIKNDCARLPALA